MSGRFSNRKKGTWTTFTAEKQYQREVGRFRPFKKEERNAAFRATETQEGRERFINHNLRLVLKIAFVYWQRHQHELNGMDFLDLVQEGNIGLMRAIKTYNLKFGFQFSTYAYNWIRQKIQRAIEEQGKIVRVPIGQGYKIKKYARTHMRLAQELGREPYPEETANRMGIDMDELVQIRDDIRATTVYSLEAILDGDRENENEPYYPASVQDRALSPLQLVILNEELERQSLEKRTRAQQISSSSLLTDREKAIYRMRYGVDGTQEPRTLEELGKQLAISRERVRQILAGALEKIDGPKSPTARAAKVSTQEVASWHGDAQRCPQTVEGIKSAVAQVSGVTPEQLVAPGRKARIALARQITMYLLREDLGLSFPQIAHELGRSNHTTALYACSEIEKRIVKNQSVKEVIDRVRAAYQPV